MKAYITIGLPGSGKSTLAKKMCIDEPNLARVNRDELRRQVLEERNLAVTWKNAMDKKHGIEGEVQKRQDAAIKRAAKEKRDVIVDNCHLSNWTQEKIQTFLRDLGYTVTVIDLRHIPLQVCLERNEKREGFDYINPSVIKSMHKDHIMTKIEQKPLPNFIMNDLPVCIICDIDGTLAEKGDRSPFDETRVFDDGVRNHVAIMLHSLMITGFVQHLFFFSGRKNSCRQETERWLAEKAKITATPDTSVSLHMRAVKDNRRDSAVKMDLFNELVKDKFNVLFWIDDRKQVIRETIEVLEIPCLNVGLLDDNF